jgi:hypothetical protein
LFDPSANSDIMPIRMNDELSKPLQVAIFKACLGVGGCGGSPALTPGRFGIIAVKKGK